MVYVNEKGKVDISREGKFMSVMPPGKSLKPVSTISLHSMGVYDSDYRNMIIAMNYSL